MRTLCDKCNEEIDTNGINKGNHAYGYNVWLEGEPHINTAIARQKKGYLCFDCQNKLKMFLSTKY